MRLDDEGRRVVEAFLSKYPSPVLAISGRNPKMARFAVRVLGADEADQVMRLGATEAAAKYRSKEGVEPYYYLMRGGVFALRSALARWVRWSRDGAGRRCPEPVSRAVESGEVELVAHPSLSAREAVVLDALYRAGLSAAEAADALGLTPNQVRLARQTGLDRLRQATAPSE